MDKSINNIALGIATLSLMCLLSLNVHAADWKYFGGAPLDGGKVGVTFYDAEGVEQSPDGHVKTWTKVFTDEVEFNRTDTENTKKVVEEAADRIVKGYVPPYCLVRENCPKYDDVINVITFESIANDPDRQPRLRILYEIDCGKKMIRTLSTILYKKGGGSESGSAPGNWGYISPETNADALCKIVCTPKRR